MLQFRCDCCGHVQTVPQVGPTDSASCVEPDDPPDGWRSFFAIAQEHDGEGGISTTAGAVLYTCPTCNSGVDVESQLAADHARRQSGLEQIARWMQLAEPPPGKS